MSDIQLLAWGFILLCCLWWYTTRLTLRIANGVIAALERLADKKSNTKADTNAGRVK